MTHIILNEEKLESFPLKSGLRQYCLLSSLFFNIVFQALSKTKGNRRKLKSHK